MTMTIQEAKVTLEMITNYCELRGITMEEYIEQSNVMHDAEIERQIDEILILNENYA